MSQSKSSRRWLNEHFQDVFVKRSKEDGYRSRAAYKLLEINQKDKLFKPGMIIIDLGAAPGGWSQVITEIIGSQGKIIALDILEMDALPDVHFIKGDFTEKTLLNELLQAIGDDKADWVVSDMAPNMSGIKGVDQVKTMYLAELALETALQVLNLQGGFLVKIFQGEGFDAYLKTVKTYFKTVKIRKPEASRARSQEVYLLAQNLRTCPK